MNKVVKETRYCKVLRQAKIRDNNVAYGIEKILKRIESRGNKICVL